MHPFSLVSGRLFRCPPIIAECCRRRQTQAATLRVTLGEMPCRRRQTQAATLCVTPGEMPCRRRQTQPATLHILPNGCLVAALLFCFSS